MHSAGAVLKEEIIEFINRYCEARNNKRITVIGSLYAFQYLYFTSVCGISFRARNLEILDVDTV